MSIYYLAARAGLPVGIFFTVISLCFMLSVRIPFLSMLIIPLLAGATVMIYLLMRRTAMNHPVYRSVNALWVFGIYTGICATLICSLISSLYLICINPSFFSDYIAGSIDIVEQSPYASLYGNDLDNMKRALENGRGMNPMMFVLSMGWTSCFAGCVISLPLAWLCSRKVSRI